ncbi:MAG: hypothetical protein ACHQQ3_07465 [Gemmatimonadales bacterium]
MRREPGVRVFADDGRVARRRETVAMDDAVVAARVLRVGPAARASGLKASA